jgi:hypothetical protein
LPRILFLNDVHVRIMSGGEGVAFRSLPGVPGGGCVSGEGYVCCSGPSGCRHGDEGSGRPRPCLFARHSRGRQRQVRCRDLGNRPVPGSVPGWQADFDEGGIVRDGLAAPEASEGSASIRRGQLRRIGRRKYPSHGSVIASSRWRTDAPSMRSEPVDSSLRPSRIRRHFGVARSDDGYTRAIAGPSVWRSVPPTSGHAGRVPAVFAPHPSPRLRRITP